MTKPQPLSGVLAPVVTPFTKDLRPDPQLFVAHCRWLLSQNCGLAVFGTNSEGNSLSVGERIDLLDTLSAAGVNTARMMPGTGCCALPDTVRLTGHAVKAGCAGVLMLPPFYYKAVSEDGLFRYFSEVIEQVASSQLRVYLYHIPPVAIVGITPELIERLIKEYPSAIAGIKDSSGDWNFTKMILDAFAGPGFDVFVGSESFLLENMIGGGTGCISATANVNPAAIAGLYRQWNGPSAETLQQELNMVRTAVGKYGMIPSLKAIIAYYSGHPEWATVRPPLIGLNAVQATGLIDELRTLGFDMPGIRPVL